MINKSKLALIAAIAVIGIASPALAQSRYDSGREAYAMVPFNPTIAPANDPAATGGGSAGYNENLKYQW